MTTVALKDVAKVFPDGTVAVDGVSLEIRGGEFMVLLGPSGCGKSTVLRMIAGLDTPTRGQIVLDGMPADDMTPRDRKVAMVFQDYALYPHMTVAENVSFPLRMAGVDEAEVAERTGEVLAALGLTEVRGRRPAHLSGGQRQRVAMGRAIIRRPELFLMDEPLSNLDSGLRAELRAEISGLVRRLGVTTLYVTHDQTEALTMADRVAILRRGVLQDVGTPAEVYNRPATLYVAAFLGNPRMNMIEAGVRVSLDRHVALHLGSQTLFIPWHDIRARAISRYHGERIVVGMRAESIAPAPPDATDNVLRGSVRYIEHHGHESLAYLDIGATAVTVDELRDGGDFAGEFLPRRRTGATVRRLAARAGLRGAGPAGPGHAIHVSAGSQPAGLAVGRVALAAAPAGGYDDGRSAGAHTATLADARHSVFSDGSHRHRRPAELVVRLAPYPSGATGQNMTVAVRMDQVHFFDEYGDRIDIGWR